MGGGTGPGAGINCKCLDKIINMGDDKGFIQQFIEWIIHNGGLYFLLFVIFAETGLFVGFFLPGDSLLFASGIYMTDLAREFFGLHWFFIIILVIIASV